MQIFPAIFSVVDQKPGIEKVISDEYDFFIDRKSKTGIIPSKVELNVIWISSGIAVAAFAFAFAFALIRLFLLSDSVYSSESSLPI